MRLSVRIRGSHQKSGGARVTVVRWLPMRVDFHTLENVLLPEIERRCASLRQDRRFGNIDFNSHHDGNTHHFWRLYCFAAASRADWTALSMVIHMIPLGPVVSLGAQIRWSFPRPRGQMPRSGHVYSAGHFQGPPDDTISDFIRALPALFRAFDRVVARGRPPSRLSQFLMVMFPLVRQRYYRLLSHATAT